MIPNIICNSCGSDVIYSDHVQDRICSGCFKTCNPIINISDATIRITNNNLQYLLDEVAKLKKIKLDSSKTVVCDIDGVLADKSHGGDYEKAKVMPNGRDAINKIKDMGYRVVLATARGGDTYPGRQYQMWYTKTYNWLVENGIKFDELVCGKNSGIIYIDDKAARVEFDNKDDWDNVFNLLEEQKYKDKYGNTIDDDRVK